jgi:hypothetical protein
LTVTVTLSTTSTKYLQNHSEFLSGTAKRTLLWDLVTGAEELHLVSSPLQEEAIPATKKPRLENPFSASTDEATATISSPDNKLSLPTAAADADHAEATTDTPLPPTEVSSMLPGRQTIEKAQDRRRKK